MLRKLRPRGSGGTSESNSDRSRSKKQRVADVTKILFDIAKESADWFPPLESALGGVTALMERYEQFELVKDEIRVLTPQLDRLRQNITTTTAEGDPEETGRREELTSTLEEIEKRSRELLAKGTVTQFVNKKGDSREVAKLVERLGEAIAHYRASEKSFVATSTTHTEGEMSQQQAIYDQIANLTSSFDTILKLLEKSPVVKTKLDSVMDRLDRLCSEEDNDDGLWDDDDHEHRTRLFDALRLIGDNRNVLYNRINTQGYKESQDDIQAASAMADDIRDAVIDYQMAQQRAVYDLNCRLIDAADLSVLNGCRRAQGAGYQHRDRKGCLRGTRETVLNDIESWARDFEKPPVFWLNGLAGTGKSTIAKTVSEHVFADGLLGASFFCSRDFEDRSDLRLIFPTLAFQLAHKYPTFRSVLIPLLRSNPDIVHESLMNQMGELIVKPLKLADVWTVIIIDALDECKDEEPQSAILSVLGRFVKQTPKVKFFITGRPEPRIKTGFRLPLLVDSTDVFVLHDVHPSLINGDIRLFLKHELAEVARRHRLEGWPGNEHIDLLCRRAGGLFVYAVATVRFLDSKIHLPKRRLEVIVNLPECTVHEGKTRFNPRSKTTLDLLYTLILKTAFSEDEDDPEVDSKVRSTIGTVVLVVNPLPPPAIAELIGLDIREVTLFLTLVQSLLAFDEDSSQPVKPFHKSFPDFITDPSRCTDTRFWISPKILHLELAMNCLRVMNDGLERNLLSLPNYALNSEVEDLKTRIDDRISDGLRYACRSWHSHLTKTEGDVTDVISCLRVFLEEKFLAWLEVVSVLGAVWGATVALEQLIGWLWEVSGNEELLSTAREYSHFVVTFFELISISAIHIYHSALELSPLSSIVRKRYYCQRHTRLPRVMVGTRESWERGIIIPSKNDCSSYSWSPCGRFIAAQSLEVVEIRDSLSLELLSTLPIVGGYSSVLACSTGGRFIASLCGTSLVIWDTQTGGVVKEIDHGGAENTSLVWSLDGSTIGIVEDESRWIVVGGRVYVVHTYDVASGAMHSPGILKSREKPHLWAYGTSFRVMMTNIDACPFTIDIFEVGSILTKIKSFQIPYWGSRTIESFSQTTYHISYSYSGRLFIRDTQDPRCLLEEGGDFYSHCFSSDGSFFAASKKSNVHIWKYASGRYVRWREFSIPDSPPKLNSLRFSPTSSSLLDCRNGVPRLWRLDGPPIDINHGSSRQLVILSRCGGYIVASHGGGNVVTITNLLSQTPPCVVDTGMTIGKLNLTGNILLALDSTTIAAWRLTEEGMVDGVGADGRAGRGNSIWTIPVLYSDWPSLYVQDQTVVIEWRGRAIHAYHTETGEVLKSIQLSPHRQHRRWGGTSLDDLSKYGWDTPSDSAEPLSWSTLREGWVKDVEGNRLLWLPVQWRNPQHIASRSYDSTVMWLDLHGGESFRSIVIKF
ncbi:hypothetical protein BDM02DRAFT_3271916 [Thelephora ganbajun]|uniref:Uncharacterized protein n=1 Tax=Thelephora ganbajun TaxID=370292 RepID=A0ACB6Z6J4_THEGA|nr:hypothetical protein BDM02DRAFT_3271916 [Thelephora ganbajun]